MPLCPQITNTPITVTQTADFTVSSVLPVVAATTTQVNAAQSSATAAAAAAATAQSTANTALANAATAFTTAQNSLQPSAFAIQNPTTKQLSAIDATGLTVYVNSPTTGARVVLNSAGLAGFNSGGSATFSISASTGAAVFSGSVTGSTITGGTLNIGGNAIIDASGFLTATGATITGNITATSGSFTGSIFAGSGTIGGFTIASTFLSGSGGFTLNSSGTIDGGNSNTLFYGFVNVGGGSPTGDRFQVNGTSNFNGTLTGLDIRANGDLFAAGHQTTTNTANGFIFTTGGRIARSTASSQRYKENIVDLRDVAELDPRKLLDFKARAFSYKTDYLDNDDRAGVLVPGLIAEEVDAIYPLCVDYENGQVENINDRAILINLLALVQDLYKQIETIKGE